jgi:long chain fatty acid CoA FadD26
MSAIDSSIPAVLGERARQQPDARAYTFIDYELDPAGDSETLTWFQVHRRAQVVAAELASCGSRGDRLAILAPQGLEYIVGVLGAMEAGFIAVPLSAPQFGAHDERVLVPPGSIPITTSGKVRRSGCAERYRQDEFTRLDTPA